MVVSHTSFISCNKGASVIRMLHNFIGNDAFRRGMNAYLTQHSYKNTQTEDLWRALTEASQKPVGEVMSTWTGQMGFPLIRYSAIGIMVPQLCPVRLNQ